jgi:hypothetical protein
MRPRAPYPDSADPDLAGIVPWRRRRLQRAGFAPALASSLAGDRRVDVHALLDLVDRGCPPELAARILAPLEGLPGSAP